MDTKNHSENLEKIFDFLDQIEDLKSTLRYTSTKNGRKESSAEHSWRLALMTFIIAKELNLNINISHAIKIALIHDIAESLTGDINARRIAEGEISKEEKQKLEMEAIEKIKGSLPPKIGKEIYNLWSEYEECLTDEAKFIKALDKLETLTQFVEMGHKTYDDPEFLANYADEAVKKFPALKGILKIIKRKLKSEFEKGNILWREDYDRLD